ncbi:phospholipase D-like domain-containing protein [Haliangium sp.]|uniref:phospholipase D-like domain-containing protein n=1 Tax=Haliangium sp. TaxID=2663208 RepID=UPI003D140DEF
MNLRAQARLRPTSPRPRWARLAKWPSRLRPGNHVDILCGGDEAYSAMCAAITAARTSVCLETYILRADAIGERFAKVLCERAAAGVEVRVIYDGLGSLGIPAAFLDRLRRAGVELLEYHPLSAPFRLTRRDHRKILVVDDHVGFTGGINIGREYASLAQGGEGWYDVHCRVHGPVVVDLARLFRRVWVREGGRPYPAPRRPVRARARDAGAHPPDAYLARVLDNRKYRKRWTFHRAHLHAINRATRTVSMMNAYFLPDFGIAEALRRAVARGVRVRVIVPEISDVAVVVHAGRHIYGALIRDGVEILCWPKVMMHAKTTVVDGTWSCIGSYNFDAVSLYNNLEVALEVVDPRFGAAMDTAFEAAAARCAVMSLDGLRRRSLFEKLTSWVLYKLRRWL